MRFQSRTPPRAQARLWRITRGAPEGEWVDLGTSPSPKVDAPETDSATWAESSFDLLYGAEITDVSETIPDALLDELFPSADDPPKRPGK
jgi:hypothetical protein